MLLHARHNGVLILEINPEKQLKDIIARDENVHLKGQYDLYFILEKNRSITMKYLTNKGYQIVSVDDSIIEHLDLMDVEETRLDFIDDLRDLEKNLITIESYLRTDFTQAEENFALSIVQKGKNLVAYKVHDEYHFAPSRFVGYKKNDMYKHLANDSKDGRETTPIINKIGKVKLQVDDRLEAAYIAYCDQLGLELHKHKRQYWLFDFSGTSFEELANNCNEEYREGKTLEGKHKRRERNRKLVPDAIKQFREKHDNRIFCEVCEFNFKEIYGIDYIEVHHLKEIADMDDEDVTSLDDVCLVCPNCHCIIHSKRPCLPIEKVKQILLENKR